MKREREMKRERNEQPNTQYNYWEITPAFGDSSELLYFFCCLTVIKSI